MKSKILDEEPRGGGRVQATSGAAPEPPKGASAATRVPVAVWAPVALVVVLALFPLVFPGELNYLGLGFLTFIFVTLAVSWNLVGGYAGQVSFGYAAFFGTAAYVTAILWSRYQWEPVLTLPLAGPAAGA